MATVQHTSIAIARPAAAKEISHILFDFYKGRKGIAINQRNQIPHQFHNGVFKKVNRSIA